MSSDLEIRFVPEFYVDDLVVLKHGDESGDAGKVVAVVARVELEYEIEWPNGSRECFNRSALRREASEPVARS